ncbi:MAG: hypothetical protein BWZ10_03104 [candidate division BRC1 bacterium ADurb.BinA364]|nr:MAG: hypothetical protein BWZ10_03104 [candidate division BRC1 bacterium ADurb.BinA364]
MPLGHQSRGLSIASAKSALAPRKAALCLAMAWPPKETDTAAESGLRETFSASISSARLTALGLEWSCDMKTVSMRASSNPTMEIGRQMPQVTKLGPQSQPKLHWLLRIQAAAAAFSFWPQ